MGYERGLIRYDTENGVKNKYTTNQLLKRAVASSCFVVQRYFADSDWRFVLSTTAYRDSHGGGARCARLPAANEDGMIENVFKLQLSNTGEVPHKVQLSVSV